MKDVRGLLPSIFWQTVVGNAMLRHKRLSRFIKKSVDFSMLVLRRLRCLVLNRCSRLQSVPD